MHRELGGHMSLVGGYYRNWQGNFRVTDNLAVAPGDYSPYCITAPTDPRLPGGGGNQVCGAKSGTAKHPSPRRHRRYPVDGSTVPNPSHARTSSRPGRSR